MSITGLDSIAYSIRRLQEETHRVAIANGWHETPRSMGDWAALVHSEVSEAYETHRTKMDPRVTLYDATGKPLGFRSEISDTIIMTLDWAATVGIDAGEGIIEKLAHNARRGYHHGGKSI